MKRRVGCENLVNSSSPIIDRDGLVVEVEHRSRLYPSFYRLFDVQLTGGVYVRGMPTRFSVVDFPQTEETDGRRAGGTSCIGDDVAMGGVSVGGS